MSKRSGGVDIETNRTSQRGVYCGAWSAYVPGEAAGLRSVGARRPSRRGSSCSTPERSPGSCRPSSRWRCTCSRAHKVGGRGSARSSASGRSCWPSGTLTGRADPPAEQSRPRPPPAPSPTCASASARCGTSWRCWPTASSPPRRCASLVRMQDEVAEQVAKSNAQRTHRAGDLRPRGPDRRLARRPRHRRRLGLRADVRRSRSGHRLAGAHLRGHRRRRRVGVAAERDRLAEVHHRHRAADEPDRRSEQAHLGTAGRAPSSTRRWTGRRSRWPTFTSCCTAR